MIYIRRNIPIRCPVCQATTNSSGQDFDDVKQVALHIAGKIRHSYRDSDHSNWVEEFVPTADQSLPPATLAKQLVGAISLTLKLQATSSSNEVFVDKSRIEELRGIRSIKFDCQRLIRYCDELNICYANECYLAVAILTRALIDHIPPIFGFGSFSEVANNYGGKGDKSLKDSFKYLDKEVRYIADSHLHRHIRNKEVLPNKTQVDFKNSLDMLLSEVVRILRRETQKSIF